MKKTKKAVKVPTKFEAVVRMTYGRGKTAVHVDVPVTIDFEQGWQSSWQKDPEFVEERACDALFDLNSTTKVLNKTAALAAYKAYKKEYGAE